MRLTGLEPARRGTPEPKSGASANSAIAAKKYTEKAESRAFRFHSEASGIRTPDNLIKSQVLYRLS